MSGVEGWPEREKDLVWLERQKETGHCGESTSDAIQRGRINGCIDRILAALSAIEGGGGQIETVALHHTPGFGALQPSASVPTEQADGAVVGCKNCADEGWVCESHQDAPWNPDGCECGAGAPCPVCSRDMACAPYSEAAREFRKVVENLISHHEGETDRHLFDTLPNHFAWAIVNGRLAAARRAGEAGQ